MLHGYGSTATDLIESVSSDVSVFRMHTTAIRHAGNRNWSLNTVNYCSIADPGYGAFFTMDPGTHILIA